MFEQINNISQLTLLLIILCVILILCLISQKISFSKKIKKERADAVNRSRAVLTGQMAEQISPFLKGFPCNPADAKFIGKPIDFIAFPGLTENNKVEEVILIEIKTGNSTLSEREKEIKKAVAEGRVRYVEYRPYLS